jgi:hypothetical protein
MENRIHNALIGIWRSFAQSQHEESGAKENKGAADPGLDSLQQGSRGAADLRVHLDQTATSISHMPAIGFIVDP